MPSRPPLGYPAAVEMRAPYVRPIPCEPDRPGALRAAGGTLFYAEVEVLSRTAPPRILPAAAAPELYPEAAPALAAIGAPRPSDICLPLDRRRIMGVVNVTPDSFSDGGRLAGAEAAIAHALGLAEAGADILDIGGESTRPGADPVSLEEEMARVLPVIRGLMAAGCPVPLSIDTRKALVAEAALAEGATLFNDVSALLHDPESPAIAATAPAVCLMHAQGTPETMQRDPRYDDVLLDVYDWLEARVRAAEAAGIPRARILVDPGIGFGKTVEHNLALIRRLSLFHGLGCRVLMGASRKRFIGTLSRVEAAERRVAGSIAAALEGVRQGAHVIRVHDVAETRQALSVWEAIRGEETGA